MEEEQTDNAGALVQYQPQVDFTQHLADLLKQEPGVGPQPSTQPWVNGQSAPQGQHLTDVDSAFNSMNLANQVTISEDSNLSGGEMPQIPSASAGRVSVLKPFTQCGCVFQIGRWRRQCSPMADCRKTSALCRLKGLCPAVAKHRGREQQQPLAG